MVVVDGAVHLSGVLRRSCASFDTVWVGSSLGGMFLGFERETC